MEAKKLDNQFEVEVQRVLNSLPKVDEFKQWQLFALLDSWSCEKIDGDFESKRLGKDLIFRGSHHNILSGLARMQDWDKPLFALDQARCTPPVKHLAKFGKLSKSWSRHLVKDLEQARLIRRINRIGKSESWSNNYQLTPVLHWEYCIFSVSKKYERDPDETNLEIYQEVIDRLLIEKECAIKAEDETAEAKPNPQSISGLKGHLVKELKKVEAKIAENSTHELLCKKLSLESKIEDLTIRHKALKNKKKSLILARKTVGGLPEKVGGPTVDSRPPLLSAGATPTVDSGQISVANNRKLTTIDNVCNARAREGTHNPSLNSSFKNQEEALAQPVAKAESSNKKSKTGKKAQEVRDQAMAIAMASPQDRELAEHWAEFANSRHQSDEFNVTEFSGYIYQIRTKLKLDPEGLWKMFKRVKADNRWWGNRAYSPAQLLLTTSVPGILRAHELASDVGIDQQTKRSKGDSEQMFEDLKTSDKVQTMDEYWESLGVPANNKGVK